MLDIDEMGSKEIQDVLQKVGYGHLGYVGRVKKSGGKQEKLWSSMRA